MYTSNTIFTYNSSEKQKFCGSNDCMSQLIDIISIAIKDLIAYTSRAKDNICIATEKECLSSR